MLVKEMVFGNDSNSKNKNHRQMVKTMSQFKRKDKKMNFSDALTNESRKTYTENGAEAYNSTLNACLDLFGSVGALRERKDSEVFSLFEEAYKEDPEMAVKIVFYARDIREGCGERQTFRTLVRYIADVYPEALRNNIKYFGEYGRFDDLYCLIGTKLENEMWDYMGEQFADDVIAYCQSTSEKKIPISLLAKWIKTPDASSKNTRELGILTAHKLGYNVWHFKKILRKLRKHIGVVESLMSTNQWDKIDYSAVPSRAMMIYRDAFRRHDESRFDEFVSKAVTGEVKINSSTLFPYDITEKFLYNPYNWYDKDLTKEEIEVLEAQWRQLPNYVAPNTNAIVVADVSGSMLGRPMATSIGLAVYFAERNIGAYHNMFMTFSSESHICKLKGNTLEQKIESVNRSDWGMSTNLEKAFSRVLNIAIDNNVPPEEMIKSLIVISDMEIDSCEESCYSRNRKSWSFYDNMRAKYHEAGYEIPNVVFWNVNSRHNIFHADATRKGVQLCSGSSVTTFKQLMDSIGLTPVEMMEKIINSERYSQITIDKQ